MVPAAPPFPDSRREPTTSSTCGHKCVAITLAIVIPLVTLVILGVILETLVVTKGGGSWRALMRWFKSKARNGNKGGLTDMEMGNVGSNGGRNIDAGKDEREIGEGYWGGARTGERGERMTDEEIRLEELKLGMRESGSFVSVETRERSEERREDHEEGAKM